MTHQIQNAMRTPNLITPQPATIKMCSKLLILAIALLQITSSLQAGEPIVQLPSGQILGREALTVVNKTFYAFEGVPYAAPPIGDLRFKAPQPTESWDGVLNTTYLEKTCYQISSDADTETEDCLFVNIYTPKLPSDDDNELLAVMLFIHGGGFVEGSNLFFTGDLFVNNDVILASIDYRLGVFGFLSTQDEVIPGNYGLKDQQFAIQWAHDNIHLFGGDPDKITIFGQSAGSASCAYQLLNQNNNGLFYGAILESGSFLSPWAYQRRAREIAFATAAILDSSFATSNDSQALLEFLQTVDAKELDAAATQYRNTGNQPDDLEISQGFYYAPVIEVKNPDAFVTKKMYGLLQAGNFVTVPTLIGITSEESLIFNPDPTSFNYVMSTYDEHLDWAVPNDMQIEDEEERVEMGRSIRDLYTGGEPWTSNLGDGIRYSSDTSFTRSVIKHAELASSLSDTYFFIFSYDGALPNRDIHYDGAESVSHGEEISFIFCAGTNCDDRWIDEADQVARHRLIKIWTDFAKYQNPTPEPSELLQNITWPKVSTEGGDFYYLDFNENLEIKNHPKQETYEGWNQLYDSLGYSDFDTY